MDIPLFSCWWNRNGFVDVSYSLYSSCGCHFFVWCDDECELVTAKKWWKWCLAVGIPCMLIFILTPSKKTAYQILGVTVATEVVKNSEALQELPEKSFEAINRFLDSIAPKDEEK